MVAALLLLGIVVVGGGSVFAATRPTWTAPKTASAPMEHARPTATRVTMAAKTHTTEAPPPPAPKATSQAGHAAGASTSSASITYTVKSGDTLSGIAQWFKLHGYGGLYRANMAVIGADPNLIFPGQRITISHGKMSMGSPARTEGSGA